jgi:hypothetical protein
MSIVRIIVPGEGAAFEVQQGDRIVHVRGGEQLTLDAELVGDRITLVLRQSAESVDRHTGVKNLGGPDTFKPVPASGLAGVSEINQTTGYEILRGPVGKRK